MCPCFQTYTPAWVQHTHTQSLTHPDKHRHRRMYMYRHSPTHVYTWTQTPTHTTKQTVQMTLWKYLEYKIKRDQNWNTKLRKWRRKQFQQLKLQKSELLKICYDIILITLISCLIKFVITDHIIYFEAVLNLQ